MRVSHHQLTLLAEGKNPETVIGNGKLDWAELVRSLAKMSLRQKALRIVDQKEGE